MGIIMYAHIHKILVLSLLRPTASRLMVRFSSLICRFGSKTTCFLFLLAFFLALRHRKLFLRKLPTPLEVVKSLSDTDWSIWLLGTVRYAHIHKLYYHYECLLKVGFASTVLRKRVGLYRFVEFWRRKAWVFVSKCLSSFPEPLIFPRNSYFFKIWWALKKLLCLVGNLFKMHKI